MVDDFAGEGQGLWNCIRPCSETYKSLSCYVDCGALNKGTGACIPKRPVSDEYVCCCTGWYVKPTNCLPKNKMMPC